MRTSITSISKSLGLLVLVLLALLVLAGPALAQQTTWYASYWNNKDLSGAPAVQRIENKAPDLGWGEGSPAPGIQPDDFSARWTADEYFEPGQYRFSLRTDDGARLWVNNQKILDIDETGVVFTSDVNVATAGKIPIRLDYWEEKGNAGVHLTWERLGNSVSTGPIRALYYNNTSLSGDPVLVRNEGPGLYHNWGNGSPAPGIVNNDQFSARYTQALDLAPGWYRFTARADDGIRFWINNHLLIDEWHDATGKPYIVDVELPGGILNFMVQYYENVGGAMVGLSMTKIGDSSGGSGGGYGGGSSLPPASTIGVVNTTALNMRSGPGPEFEPIRVLYEGDIVTLTGLYEGYWVHVTTQDNFAGWVSAQYLDYQMPVGEITPAG